METIPYSVLIEHIVGCLHVSDLPAFCLSCHKYFNIWKDEKVWNLLINRDYPKHSLARHYKLHLPNDIITSTLKSYETLETLKTYKAYNKLATEYIPRINEYEIGKPFHVLLPPTKSDWLFGLFENAVVRKNSILNISYNEMCTVTVENNVLYVEPNNIFGHRRCGMLTQQDISQLLYNFMTIGLTISKEELFVSNT